MQISHLDKVRLEKKYGIILIYLSKPSGQKRGIYLKVKKDMMQKLNRLKDINIEKLKEYGEIVAEFEGDEPSQDILDKINAMLAE